MSNDFLEHDMPNFFLFNLESALDQYQSLISRGVKASHSERLAEIIKRLGAIHYEYFQPSIPLPLNTVRAMRSCTPGHTREEPVPMVLHEVPEAF